MFTQHVQAGGVINFYSHQKDGADSGVAQGTRRPQRRKTSNLLRNAGEGVEQHTVMGIATDGDGRLDSCGKARAALAPSVATGVIAVPLRETAADCGV